MRAARTGPRRRRRPRAGLLGLGLARLLHRLMLLLRSDVVLLLPLPRVLLLLHQEALELLDQRLDARLAALHLGQHDAGGLLDEHAVHEVERAPLRIDRRQCVDHELVLVAARFRFFERVRRGERERARRRRAVERKKGVSRRPRFFVIVRRGARKRGDTHTHTSRARAPRFWSRAAGTLAASAYTARSPRAPRLSAGGRASRRREKREARVTIGTPDDAPGESARRPSARVRTSSAGAASAAALSAAATTSDMCTKREPRDQPRRLFGSELARSRPARPEL